METPEKILEKLPKDEKYCNFLNGLYLNELKQYFKIKENRTMFYEYCLNYIFINNSDYSEFFICPLFRGFLETNFKEKTFNRYYIYNDNGSIECFTFHTRMLPTITPNITDIFSYDIFNLIKTNNTKLFGTNEARVKFLKEVIKNDGLFNHYIVKH